MIAFERQIFPPNPLEAMELVKYVNHLIDLTVRLQRLNTDKTVDIDDYRQRARLWWEEWLDPMSADPVTLDHISFEIGIEVFQNIWQEMSHISRLISSVGAGLGTTA